MGATGPCGAASVGMGSVLVSLGVRQEPGYSQAVLTWSDRPFPMSVLSILVRLLTKFKYIVMDAFTRQLQLSPLGRRETPEPR